MTFMPIKMWELPRTSAIASASDRYTGLRARPCVAGQATDVGVLVLGGFLQGGDGGFGNLTEFDELIDGRAARRGVALLDGLGQSRHAVLAQRRQAMDHGLRNFTRRIRVAQQVAE